MDLGPETLLFGYLDPLGYGTRDPKLWVRKLTATTAVLDIESLQNPKGPST